MPRVSASRLVFGTGPRARVPLRAKTRLIPRRESKEPTPNESHDVSKIFPLMSKAELERLAADIKTQGLLQPITTYEGKILDGKSRYAACRLAGVEPAFRPFSGSDPIAFVVSANLQRRYLTPSQMGPVGAEVKKLYVQQAKERQREAGRRFGQGKVPEKIQEAIAERSEAAEKAANLVGVNPHYIYDAERIAAKSPELYDRVKAGKITIPNALQQLKEQADRDALVAARKRVTAARRQELESVCELHVCSCAELFARGIHPDAVITDPPYGKKFLPVYTELAKACAKAQVPLVAVMVGHSFLPEVLQRLCEHLTYRWTLAYLMPGNQAAQVWAARINTFWKPVILFGKASRWLGRDVAVSKPNGRDKRFHCWGQSESGMVDLVSRLTEPGQLVCDPLLGGGTTAVVSLALGRRFVGCDIDAACVKMTRRRVEVGQK
jgi:hypothetical protein